VRRGHAAAGAPPGRTRRSCSRTSRRPRRPRRFRHPVGGRGPVIEHSGPTLADVLALRPFEPEAASPCPGGDPDHPPRVPGAADRVRGRAVHARLLHRGGRPVARLRAHQAADARGSRDVGGAARRPDRNHHPLPAGTGGRRRRGHPGVRLVGGRPQPARL
jgi:hypothetical protein